EARFLFTVENERAGLRFKSGKRGDKAFQILEHGQANLVGWRAVQDEFDDTISQLPRKRFSFIFVHAFSLRLSESPGSAGILPAAFEFDRPDQSRRDAGTTNSS